MTPAILLVFACRRTLMPDVAMPAEDPTDEWAEVLAEVVTQDGYVDYELLAENRDALDRYVVWLSRDDQWVDDKITAHRHGFYLNAFNALVMYSVLENDRPASVLDVQGWIPLAGSGFFMTSAFDIELDHLSLQEIRDERIRQFELDYRSHSAMVFGARGGPPMSPELYGNGALHSQLRTSMKRWVSDPERGVRIVDGVAMFNPIMDWYRRDFHFFSAGLDLCTIAARHTDGEQASELRALADRGCPHGFYEFDWSLNDAR
ncbi:MAG: hypothetical protein ACI8PZ_004071 [Myxococcota bacterium]|jgi:hypothetical protein